jgi:GNAT superfamily N-acetyltransferase
MLLTDLALSRRLERTEAVAGARFVEARARLQPESGACWIDVAGAYAMFDTPASPVTQTFGLGLFDKVASAELDRLEAFFRERGAPVHHEVSPIADPELLPLLTSRGYQPIELTSVMHRPTRGLAAAPRNERIRVRLAQDGEEDLCARIGVDGWKSEHPELEEFLSGIGQINARRTGALSLLAELDGRPVATGVLILHEGVALLGGACTIPEARRQGAQRALLDGRLRHGAERGCDIAMMCAAPGSASQRNAERHGFRIAYTRIKWQRS